MSPQASAKAVGWGYQNVYYIKGAVDAWDAAGFSVKKGE
jgi:rhodanese-related sulfurtransferase